MEVLRALLLGSLFSKVLVNAQGIKFGPTIAEITPEWNNVFPAANFNRNVSTAFWQPTIMNDSTTTDVANQLSKIGKASFIVYDKEMYQVNYHSPRGRCS